MFFIVTLFPALGFFDVYPFRYSYVADHFQYAASIGVIAVISAIGEKWVKPHLKILIGTVLLCTLTFLTWRQSKVYANNEVLWTDVVRKNPNAWIAHHNLTAIFFDSERVDEAISHFESCVKLNPKNSSLTYYALGLAYSQKGDTNKAIEFYDKAADSDPGSQVAVTSMADACFLKGQYRLAVENYKKALQLKPPVISDIEINCRIGSSLKYLGNYKDALVYFERAIIFIPNNPILLTNIKEIKQLQGFSNSKK